MESNLAALPPWDMRRPQQGDEVRLANGVSYGWVSDVRPGMVKVRVGPGTTWLGLDAVARRQMGVVMLSCDSTGVLKYAIGLGG